VLYLAGEALIKAQPLLFTALSFALASHAGLVNIGAEGQLYAGALCATLAALFLDFLPGPLLLAAAVLAGFAGGAFWGAAAAALKLRFAANEVITTIMLNYIAYWTLSLAVSGPLIETPGGYPVSPPLPAALPRLPGGTRLHAGIFIALAAAFAVDFVLRRTTLGFRIRATGFNANAARCAGIRTGNAVLSALLLAGGLAGLGGACEILGVQHRLLAGFSPGYGFDGIAVALVGRNNAPGILCAALFFGILRMAANQMQMSYQIPVSVLLIIEAGIVLVLAKQMTRENRD
jgi:simple sugar transport system permease protein